MAVVLDVNGYVKPPFMGDDVEGCIVKISEGRDVNADYDVQVQNAVGQRKPVGVYCYTHARTPERAAEEARVVINKLKERPDLDLSIGVFIDMEDANMPDTSPFGRAEIIMGFINELTKWRNDINVGVYSGYYAMRDSIDTDALPPYVKLWVAQYNDNCDWPDPYLWQFTDGYVIDGTKYDANVWYK